MQLKPRFYEEPIGADILQLFELNSEGAVCWIARPDGARGKSPWGSRAGGRPVLNHGYFVTARNCALLSGDIASAIQHGGDWPYQTGDSAHVQHRYDDDYKELALERFTLDAGRLVWRVDRGDTENNGHKAGSLVTGTLLSGFRQPVVFTSGIGFLVDELPAMIINNNWD